MQTRFAVLLLLGFWLSATAAPTATTVTVQGAIKLLTKDQAKNLVRIEAREGTPAPDRWYFQVYDPTAENGLREIVVWQKNVVTTRSVSQFLDSAKPEDVVGAKLVRTDSDELIRIAQRYVEEHNLNVEKINYTMCRDDAISAPVWRLSCFDDSDRKVAEIVINARTAAVVSHNEFDPAAAPSPAAKPAIAVAPAATPEAGPPSATAPETATISPSPSPADTASPSPSHEIAAESKPKARPSPPPAIPSPTRKPGLFHRLFGGGKPTPSPTPRTN